MHFASRATTHTFAALLLLTATFSHNAVQAMPSPAPAATIAKPKTIVDKVSSLYLQSLTAQDTAEQAELAQKKEAFERKADKKIHYDTQEVFLPVDQLKTAYAIHDQTDYGVDTSYNATITENTLTDLHLFCGDQETPQDHVLAHIDHTKTRSGLITLQTLLAQPITSIEKLKQRQDFVKLLMHDEQLYQEVIAMLEKIKDGEAQLLSVMRTMQKEVELYYKEVLFDDGWLAPLNKNATFMQTGTYLVAGREVAMKVLVDLITASLMGLVDRHNWGGIFGKTLAVMYGVATFFPDVPVPGRVISAALGLWSLYLVGNGLYKLNKRLPIIAQLKEKMCGVAQALVVTHRDLVHLLMNHPEANILFADLPDQEISEVVQNPSKKILKTLQSLHDGSLQAGKSAATFTKREEFKENFGDSYKLFGFIDAYTSIATLLKVNAKNKNGVYCFADYVVDKKPIIDFTDCWHPMLNPDKVVTNSIMLGGAHVPSNAFITGPNAGGKTTALRSIGIATLMAQTLGIAPARKARLAPFSNIATYLNIADSEGKKSLFQAEMYRARTLLDTIKNLTSNKFSFVIVDELFTGTNPKEGTAAAFGVAKKLSSYENSMALITTHFIELTGMAAETKRFVNFKVSVREVAGKFQFPYLLEHGIADQNIALQLLDEEGFDEDILQDAKEYMKRK